MDRVIKNYLWSTLVVTMAIGAGFVAGWFITREFSPAAVGRWRQTAFMGGTGMLLVAGIGRLGWSIQTYKSQSPAEKIDRVIFWILSVGGTHLLVFDFALGKYTG
jgi:O-antigen/teichoic acid export membrane protein